MRISDWSSDVCSSELGRGQSGPRAGRDDPLLTRTPLACGELHRTGPRLNSASETPASDAFVFFGATGDLAYKKIFPALQTLVARGGFDMPVIGVGHSGWPVDQLRERARDSLEHNGGVISDRRRGGKAWCHTW